MADINPQLPQIRRDTQMLADLGEVYADAAPDLFDGLENAVTTARTVNEQRANLDQALTAAVGVGNTGGDLFERSGPYLVGSVEDLVITSRVLDSHSPALYCSIRNGYFGLGFGTIVGVGNPYIDPDNLPRVNATGGPEGRPGRWQPILIEYVWGRQVGANTINP